MQLYAFLHHVTGIYIPIRRKKKWGPRVQDQIPGQALGLKEIPNISKYLVLTMVAKSRPSYFF